MNSRIYLQCSWCQEVLRTKIKKRSLFLKTKKDRYGETPSILGACADRFLARLTSHVVGRNRQCPWKKGSVHVPNFKSFLVTEAEGKHAGDARHFNSIVARAVIKFFFLHDKAQKEMHSILRETLGEHAPSYAVRNRVAQFKRGGFPPVMRLVLDDPKQ